LPGTGGLRRLVRPAAAHHKEQDKGNDGDAGNGRDDQLALSPGAVHDHQSVGGVDRSFPVHDIHAYVRIL
jgi:hypothetical protein